MKYFINDDFALSRPPEGPVDLLQAGVDRAVIAL
jgi:hypothetical protein